MDDPTQQEGEELSSQNAIQVEDENYAQDNENSNYLESSAQEISSIKNIKQGSVICDALRKMMLKEEEVENE